jgi:hypothetical protein
VKRLFLVLIIFANLTFVSTAKADLFGADVGVLTSILAEAIQQLSTLQSIVGTGQDTLGLMRDIHKGINDSLDLLKTINPADPGTYADWLRAYDAVRKLKQIYGESVDSPEAGIQNDADQSVAEAIALNNSIYQQAEQTDQIGEQVKDYSHTTSPDGAQKLTAQTLGVMIHVLNSSARAQATGLKLQAQTLAIQNRKDKEMTKYLLGTSASLGQAFANQKTGFEVPRF